MLKITNCSWSRPALVSSGLCRSSCCGTRRRTCLSSGLLNHLGCPHLKICPTCSFCPPIRHKQNKWRGVDTEAHTRKYLWRLSAVLPSWVWRGWNGRSRWCCVWRWGCWGCGKGQAEASPPPPPAYTPGIAETWGTVCSCRTSSGWRSTGVKRKERRSSVKKIQEGMNKHTKLSK